MSSTRLRKMTMVVASTLIVLSQAAGARGEDPWLVFQGGDGPGSGKHVVLVSGDEEYRSEEALPLLARILADHHGFRCTVLFAIDPDGTINPENQGNIPVLDALDEADVMVLFTRFRELPDEQMRHIVRFVDSGKPILGMRTATHAFAYRQNPASPYAHYSFDSERWPGGFGRQVLGDTWVNHHGHHKVESTRGVINTESSDHPILRGVEDICGPTDVYGLAHLPQDAEVLVYGQVLAGMQPTDPAVDGSKNEPMVPVVWTRHYRSKSGEMSRILATTMGASVDLESEGLRRILVNGVYWAVGLEEAIPAKSDVSIIGEFEPTFYGFGDFKKGRRPSDYGY